MLVVLAVPASFLIRRAVDGSERREPVSSGPAPAFSLSSVDGRTVSLSDLAGRPAIVHFWGTYCEDCRVALTRLVDTRRDHPELALAGIIYRDEPETGRAEAEAAGADWPQLIDPEGKVAQAYGVKGAPITFFLSRDGHVAGHLVGQITTRLIERQLTRIL